MNDALHVKYRPKRWDEVLGQNHVVQSLRQSVERRRAHTYLLTGPSGTGKTTLARIMANAFVGEGNNAANIEEFKAAEHAGVEDVRAIVERTTYRAIGKSSVKVFILDEVHRLSRQGWDVLLKVTEEPPEHCFWIFCTTEAGKIPKTMLTRCLRYDLKPVPEGTILALLMPIAKAEKLQIPKEVLETIAEGSGNSPRQALVFLEACLNCTTASLARAVMRTAGQDPNVAEMCRWLISGRAYNWLEAMKYLKAMADLEPESVRIIVCNYLAAVLANTKSDNEARKLLGLLECFSTEYRASEKAAPLMRSVGLAIGLDRD